MKKSIGINLVLIGCLWISIAMGQPLTIPRLATEKTTWTPAEPANELSSLRHDGPEHVYSRKIHYGLGSQLRVGRQMEGFQQMGSWESRLGRPIGDPLPSPFNPEPIEPSDMGRFFVNPPVKK